MPMHWRNRNPVLSTCSNTHSEDSDLHPVSPPHRGKLAFLEVHGSLTRHLQQAGAYNKRLAYYGKVLWRWTPNEYWQRVGMPPIERDGKSDRMAIDALHREVSRIQTAILVTAKQQ